MTMFFLLVLYLIFLCHRHWVLQVCSLLIRPSTHPSHPRLATIGPELVSVADSSWYPAQRLILLGIRIFNVVIADSSWYPAQRVILLGIGIFNVVKVTTVLFVCLYCTCTDKHDSTWYSILGILDHDDIPCISTKYIHGISLDIHGISFDVYTW